ncbi:MAG TPA: winged helix-turn-helix domain-containing protein [Thermoanaerobaculia bacterium]
MKDSSPPAPPRRLLFDDFELRLDSGELLRSGSAVKLQPLPTKVLEVLAARSGEVVSREEIRQLVWGDAFLDFDSSLNFCILQIRKALEDSATEPRYVETVPKRGYRFLRPVRVEPPPEAEPAPEPRARWPVAAGVGMAALAILLVVLLVASRRLGPFHSTPRLAVLPLECRSAEAADRPVCDGITEAITAELSRRFPRDLEVIAPGSALAYGRSLKDQQEIGEKLGATHLLQGTADPSGGQIRIAMRLTRGKDLLWKESFETDLGDAPLLYGQLVRRVAQELGLPPPPSEPRKVAKRSAAGHERYLQGLYRLRQREWKKAAAVLHEAVTLDPDYAPAHAALAHSYLEQDIDLAEAAARRALELDPQSADAYAVLGSAHLLRHDWKEGGRELRKALALNPGLTDAHHWYAFWLSFQGRHDEAISSIERAIDLDPASMLVGSDYAWVYYLARRYEDAIRRSRDTLALIPVNQTSLPRAAHDGKYFSYIHILHSAREAGDQETALDAGKQLMEMSGVGTEAKLLRSLPDLWRWRGARDRNRPPSYEGARVAVLLGDQDRSLKILEQVCQRKGDWWVLSIAVDPVFDPLRSDPRFPKILDCLGLPIPAPAAARSTPDPGWRASARGGTAAPAPPYLPA